MSTFDDLLLEEKHVQEAAYESLRLELTHSRDKAKENGNAKKEGNSLEDWQSLMTNWSALERTQPGFIHRKILDNGIHDVVRGQLWIALGSSASLKKKNASVLEQLLLQDELGNSKISISVEECISRDVKRTFPRHQFFTDPCTSGQLHLFQLLRAYAVFDPELGYCQGMGYIAAVLLCYMPLEDAFWLFTSLLRNRKYKLRLLFLPGMPKFEPVMDTFSLLIERRLPKLSSYFRKLNVQPGMYASQWFMTIFSYNFPFSFVVRVWDLFLIESWSIVFRVALVLLLEEQDELLQLDFESVLLKLRDIHKNVQTDPIISKALKLNVSEHDITSLFD